MMLSMKLIRNSRAFFTTRNKVEFKLVTMPACCVKKCYCFLITKFCSIYKPDKFNIFKMWWEKPGNYG